MRLLAAPDKFRGTLTAREAAAAIAAGAARTGWDAVELPLADGGEGTLDVLGGGNRSTVVTGPPADPLDAADVFAPQKGATPEQVEILRRRLAQLDVPDLPGAGAAGGLAGGLAARGARLIPGFDLVAQRLGFDHHLAAADLLVTGEGRLDATSVTGKVVGRALE